MANRKEKITKALRVQQSIEGYTPETGLLFKVLTAATTSADWRVLVTVKYHRYGPMSYEVHRFYYPSSLLKKIEEVLK